MADVERRGAPAEEVRGGGGTDAHSLSSYTDYTDDEDYQEALVPAAAGQGGRGTNKPRASASPVREGGEKRRKRRDPASALATGTAASASSSPTPQRVARKASTSGLQKRLSQRQQQQQGTSGPRKSSLIKVRTGGPQAGGTPHGSRSPGSVVVVEDTTAPPPAEHSASPTVPQCGRKQRKALREGYAPSLQTSHTVSISTMTSTSLCLSSSDGGTVWDDRAHPDESAGDFSISTMTASSTTTSRKGYRFSHLRGRSLSDPANASISPEAAPVAMQRVGSESDTSPTRAGGAPRAARDAGQGALRGKHASQSAPPASPRQGEKAGAGAASNGASPSTTISPSKKHAARRASDPTSASGAPANPNASTSSLLPLLDPSGRVTSPLNNAVVTPAGMSPLVCPVGGQSDADDDLDVGMGGEGEGPTGVVSPTVPFRAAYGEEGDGVVGGVGVGHERGSNTDSNNNNDITPTRKKDHHHRPHGSSPKKSPSASGSDVVRRGSREKATQGQGGQGTPKKPKGVPMTDPAASGGSPARSVSSNISPTKSQGSASDGGASGTSPNKSGGGTEGNERSSPNRASVAMCAPIFDPSSSIYGDYGIFGNSEKGASVVLKDKTATFEGMVHRTTKLPHGYGTKTYKNGSTLICGRWINGVPQGECLHTMPNGDQYRGHFQDGTKDGVGITTKVNGAVYEEVFERGHRVKRTVLQEALVPEEEGTTVAAAVAQDASPPKPSVPRLSRRGKQQQQQQQPPTTTANGANSNANSSGHAPVAGSAGAAGGALGKARDRASPSNTPRGVREARAGAPLKSALKYSGGGGQAPAPASRQPNHRPSKDVVHRSTPRRKSSLADMRGAPGRAMRRVSLDVAEEPEITLGGLLAC